MYRKNKLKLCVFLFILILLVVIYPIRIRSLYFLKFSDELITLLLIIYLLLKFFFDKIKLLKIEKYILIIYLIITGSGLVFSIFFHKNRIYNGFADLIVFSKFLFAYFGARVFFKNFNILLYKNSIRHLWSWIVFLIIFILMLNLIYPVFPVVEKRFSIPAQKLFFGHPSRLAFFFAFSFSILFGIFYPKKQIFLFLILLGGFFSLRVKYFAFIVIGVSSMVWIRSFPKISLRNIKLMIILILSVIIICIFSFWRIKDYLKYGLSASRIALFFTSFCIANDYFPFGTGFGTFASYYSANKGYSKLYYEYKLSHIKGITSESPTHVADTYWPMVIAQFGWLGLILMICLVSLFGYILVKLYNSVKAWEEKFLYFSGILLYLHLLIDSLADAIFSQNRAVAAFIYFAVLVNTYINQRKIESNINQ